MSSNQESSHFGSHSEKAMQDGSLSGDHSNGQMPSSHIGQKSHHMHSVAQLGEASTWIVLATFLLIGLFFSRKSKIKSKNRRIDLLKFSFLEKIVRSKYFSFSLRLIPSLFFVLIIATGLFGRASFNFAAPFTWLFWWTLLIFFVAFGGKIFCAVCPWDFFANLIQFGWFYRIREKTSGLNLKWPKILKSIYPAILLFIIFTWLELGVGVAYNSFLTAILGLVIVGAAIVCALIFEKRGFCRYACPVGRISGIYSQFSPIELRTRDPQVCADCKTKDCVKGGLYSTPCPTGEIPFRLKQNTYCTLCTECIRSCDKSNLTLKLRHPGTDLESASPVKKDEALLAVTILVLTFFHGLTMISAWHRLMEFLQSQFNMGHLGAITTLMAIGLFLSYLVYGFFEAFTDKIFKEKGLSHKLIFAVIPLVLGYHLGHNLMHVLSEISYLVPLVNDPFGFGWDLFGFREFKPRSLMDHNTIIMFQLAFICVGFYYSVKILNIRIENLTRTLVNSLDRRAVYFSQYAFLLIIGLISVWFVFQPMVMRSQY